MHLFFTNFTRWTILRSELQKILRLFNYSIDSSDTPDLLDSKRICGHFSGISVEPNKGFKTPSRNGLLSWELNFFFQGSISEGNCLHGISIYIYIYGFFVVGWCCWLAIYCNQVDDIFSSTIPDRFVHQDPRAPSTQEGVHCTMPAILRPLMHVIIHSSVL